MILITIIMILVRRRRGTSRGQSLIGGVRANSTRQRRGYSNSNNLNDNKTITMMILIKLLILISMLLIMISLA